MPQNNLTEGAIPMLFTDDAPKTGVKPVLQVAEITLLKTRNQNSNIERYRIWLSDGMFYQQGMLDQQLNDLVRSEKIQKGSIVQLNKFVLDFIKNCLIILIFDLDVLLEKCECIGEPTLFKTEGNNYSMTRTFVPVQTEIINPHLGAAGSVMDASWPNVASGVHVRSSGMVAERRPIAQNQQFHFCALSELEGTENSSIVDVIGVVSSVSPSSSVKTKRGIETPLRTLQLNDMSGRSVELTLWNNFCNIEGQILQTFCDSREFPVLAVKSCRVRDFYGKVVWTIPTSQLFIEPDLPEAHNLKAWFDNEGKNVNSISISRYTNMVQSDVRKTISQIKDERLGTSEKPDWVTVCATLALVEVDNFFYTACPICIKKVTDYGDGKWRCDRCNQLVDECDYRYILRMKIQDQTGFMWITAFQESGEEFLGRSAQDLYCLKYEEQDDETFSEVMRNVLYAKYLFTLKVKEETFNNEKRIKYALEKAEKVNLDSIAKFKMEVTGSLHLESREYAAPIMNHSRNTANMDRESGVPSQPGSYCDQYIGSRLPMTGSTSTYMSCKLCGGAGHGPENCPSPSIVNGLYRGSFGYGTSPWVTGSGETLKCFKCHLFGHWARDCPGFLQ
ncbi:replication protein A 70 kDa DNA-binding subunit E-like isoform X2 [Olea europaea var. sylvestris]|uniref:Replication A 70 kDa DNA-binding subunit A n=1 Tax=Olea europaea subsp. europaea TaxID=158383 RepID=A0A8S0Q180_OLEEU|nr:replication protein A 70 kDa DNA-binding subunit E-like isoform X2 [Olea europaea var. sylvestris]CAA2960609.1 replication A 70 kDa DNA-binding subunit A [Olea europaea subsp. europaea]